MHRYQACVYGNDPGDDFYRLSVADLRALKLVGLPVRVEHEPSQDVGRITEATVTPDGRAYITYDLDETPAGWACAELIAAGSLAQTSLKHAAYPDGRKEALEVSLVVKGARPGTDIYSDCASRDYIKDAGVVVVCASRVEMADVAVPPPAAAAAAPLPPAAAAVPALTAAVDEPDAKRARGADGRFVPAETPAGDAALPSVLEAVSAHVKDPATLQSLYSVVGGLLSNLDVNSKELEQLREANAALARAKAENENSTRTMSKQITRVLDSLYRTHANTNFDDAKAAVLEEAFVKFPKLHEALQPIVVAASNVEAALLRKQQDQTNEQLAAAKEQVNALYSKLGQYQRAAGVPSGAPVAPGWTPVVVAAAAPVVEVAASGAAAAAAAAAPAAQSDPFANNPALAGLRSFVASSWDNRVKSDAFTRAVSKVQQQ